MAWQLREGMVIRAASYLGMGGLISSLNSATSSFLIQGSNVISKGLNFILLSMLIAPLLHTSSVGRTHREKVGRKRFVN